MVDLGGRFSPRTGTTTPRFFHQIVWKGLLYNFDEDGRVVVVEVDQAKKLSRSAPDRLRKMT